MFGYVTPLKAELKVKDFTKFRSYYCGLCMHIKSSAGNLPRMVLNYDMTFLAVLLDSLSTKEPTVEIKRCIVHPIEKKPIIMNNDALQYAAAINLTLYYYKVKDDVEDDNNLKSKILEKILLPYEKKVNVNIEDIRTIIEENLKELSTLERNKDFSSIDEIAHPFSHIVGSILKSYPQTLVENTVEIRDDLYNLGYTLGKWIYLVDAFDDLKEDMDKNKFNPINFLFNKDNLPYKELLPLFKDRLEFTILNCSFNCKQILDRLPIKRNEDILRNVLELGMMDKYLGITKKTSEDKKE